MRTPAVKRESASDMRSMRQPPSAVQRRPTAHAFKREFARSTEHSERSRAQRWLQASSTTRE